MGNCIYGNLQKNKDGTDKLDKNGNKIVTGYSISFIKTQEDDDGARLAEQLGLTGDDATQFASAVGDSSEVTINKSLIKSAAKENRGILKEISKFLNYVGDKLTAQANSDRKKNKTNPDSDRANCAGTADYCAGGSGGRLIDPPDYDKMLMNESLYTPVEGANLTIRDVIRYATAEGGVHFTSFIFREDDGTPIVFSKSGTKGRYETGTAQGIADKYQPFYGSIDGYYRKR